jgi:hypothetical protein
MGTSNWQNISYCCDLIYRIAPQRTLDIGIGSLGRWAVLIREFVDVWQGRVLPGKWSCVIDGIEAFQPVVREFHYALYDHIYIGDAYETIDRLDTYDLIVLGDVIEHFPPERAAAMLQKCVRHARQVMVVTPLGALEQWPQEAIYDNQWERHRTLFTRQDFLRSPAWRVVEHRMFKDYIGRDFGVFLLQEPLLAAARA